MFYFISLKQRFYGAVLCYIVQGRGLIAEAFSLVNKTRCFVLFLKSSTIRNLSCFLS